MQALIAHSRNDAGQWHLLSDHLTATAQAAAAFTGAWGDPFWGRLAGAWHDLGKARAGFLAHVQRDPDAHIEGRIRNAEKTHSAAGALHAMSEFTRVFNNPAGAVLARPLQYMIAGHHAGLADWHPETGEGLQVRLASPMARTEYEEALAGLRQHGQALGDTPPVEALLTEARGWFDDSLPLGRSLRLRMLFSALVDADFLDTEAHFEPAKGRRRSDFPPIAEYASRLRAHLDDLSRRAAQPEANNSVLQARTDVLDACRRKAAEQLGAFTLTVPTGGGKTLSSLSFALEHALRHGLNRVIYAIPYTSIIEQTATVFAEIFGEGNVVEHHSQAEARDSVETTASRLATENWDAPLIVTTNVQLFESLFAARTSRCRKLHRLAGSVIVLDEAQMLPPEFLQPILDALNVLLARFRVSLLLCTATQPVLSDSQSLDPRKRLRGLPAAQPIIDAPAKLFAQLKRTRIHWPHELATPTELPELAERLQLNPCALAIVNTRRDAVELARLLPRESTLHLSAALCGAHRADLLADLRRRLSSRQAGGNEPLHVVSTQLIEAGVDVDFPTVFRALAGLDSIAQAAGRCNREGRAADPGQVHVFVRPIPRPLTLLRSAAETTVSLHAQGLKEHLTPDDFERYFRLFYSRQPGLDVKGICELLEDRDARFEFSFRTAAERFKLIDDAGQACLLIPLHEVLPGHDDLAPLIKQLQTGKTDRWLLRKLQRYVLNVHAHQFQDLERSGAVTPLPGGWFLLIDPMRYDPRFGLLTHAGALDAMTLVQ